MIALIILQQTLRLKWWVRNPPYNQTLRFGGGLESPPYNGCIWFFRLPEI
ncbi:MAG: hypothetical protein IJV35_05055 [Neisseriaceae bacterium]|nr:hypothetical protein [Neisseriaceae bacterium]